MSVFVALEGIEGAGKSTIMQRIKVWCMENGIEFCLTREPGGTPLAESIRSVLADCHNKTMSSEAELLLMFASRAQHVQEIIRPALEKGSWVISDRFIESSYAYQGGGRGLPFEWIDQLSEMTVGTTIPTLTVLLDVPVEVGLQRIRQRGLMDRIDTEEAEFFSRVRRCYLDRASQDPQRYCVVAAQKPVDEVWAQVVKRLNDVR